MKKCMMTSIGNHTDFVILDAFEQLVSCYQYRLYRFLLVRANRKYMPLVEIGEVMKRPTGWVKVNLVPYP
jgi:hypothetical protein